MSVAIVRGIADTYEAATRAAPVPIDVGRAREQHAAYVAALEALGFEIWRLSPHESMPDGCFVEDQAVVVGPTALMTRSGHPGRRAESPSVATALQALGIGLVRMTDGVLDGGDVLRVGDTLYVGVSGRSDPAGQLALRRTFPALEVRPLTVPNGTLHLKSVC